MRESLRHPNEDRVLVLAPFGRDAALSVQMLQRAGMDAEPVASVDALVEQIRLGVGAIMIAGEALDVSRMKTLAVCMASQPPWSDIPVIIMTSEKKAQLYVPVAMPAFEEIGNVTFLPRPFSVRTVIGVVRFALRSRFRQYAMREALFQLDERTRELSRSNAEFEAFAYTAAHDMREPIRMIEAYLSIVAERFHEMLGPSGTQYIATATAAAGRMRTLLQALLAYAHVGNSGLVATSVSLKEIASAATKNLSTAIAACHGNVVLPCDDRTVLGDEALLTQLLQNLIGNGLKFQKPGAVPRIEVTWADDGDQWTCSVRDNGIGIPSEARERIFAIFQRLHGMGEYPGSGIGLATCRRIVDRHGGRIWVESEVGVGSIFHITVPVMPITGVAVEVADRTRSCAAHASTSDAVIPAVDPHVGPSHDLPS